MSFYFRNNGEPKWESYTIENNNWNSVIIFFKKGYVQCIKMSCGANISQNSLYLQKIVEE